MFVPNRIHHVAAVVCLLTANTAFAQGFVGQPSFDKPSYVVGETATLSMQGKGLCKGIEIDWGDGGKTTLPSWDFGPAVGAKNLQAGHAYAKAQKYFPSIKTIPGPTLSQQCGGNSTSVTVLPPPSTQPLSAGKPGTVTSVDGKPVGTPTYGDGASSKIDHTSNLVVVPGGNGPPPCAIVVNSVSPASVKPGDQFTITGCGFGYVNGQAQLDGNFPGGVLNLIVKDWTDTKIVVAVPSDISAVPDQTTTLEVKTYHNVVSTKPGVAFVALRETRELTLMDFSTRDYSHGLVTSVVTGGGPPSYTCGASICAKHKVAAVQTPPFNGDDHYQLTLKNGWVYTSHVFDNADSGSDVDLFNCAIPSGVAPKPTLVEANTGSPLSFKVHNVFWGCLSWTTYRLKVTLSGPKGTAFN